MKQVSLLISFVLLLFGSGFQRPDVPDIQTGINWYSMGEAQQLANSGEKKILIYMEASWCGYCKKMEREVFPQKEIQDAMHEYFYPVRLDIESEKEITYNGEHMTEQEFANSIRITGTPTYLFVDSEGKILGKQPGFLPADVFKSLLTYVGTDAFNRIKFDQFMNETGR